MSERLKEPVLKTGDVQASVGSNPTLSSTKEQAVLLALFFTTKKTAAYAAVFLFILFRNLPAQNLKSAFIHWLNSGKRKL